MNQKITKLGFYIWRRKLDHPSSWHLFKQSLSHFLTFSWDNFKQWDQHLDFDLAFLVCWLLKHLWIIIMFLCCGSSYASALIFFSCSYFLKVKTCGFIYNGELTKYEVFALNALWFLVYVKHIYPRNIIWEVWVSLPSGKPESGLFVFLKKQGSTYES